MAFKPIEWEALTPNEQLALAACGEQGPLAFTALWFNITQGDSFKTNWHHHYFDWAARKVLNREVKSLIVNIPPGGTKTEFWSVHFPVFCMTQYPRVRILNTSYSKDLVTENSERSRSLVKSAEFSQFYPFNIGKDKVDDWTVDVNGKRSHQLFSRPSGGQITGVRGGYMTKAFSGYVMADDWDKMDDLFSETKRNRSNTRLINTLRSRRADSNTPFIFVQQRGHTDDSTAFLLSGGMGIDIDLHITIPALINQEYIDSLPDGIRERCIKSVCDSKKVGDYWAYWPEKDHIDDLLALRDAHPYTFSSQYQQSPESLDGGIFSAEDFLYYSEDQKDIDDNRADLLKPNKFEYRFITVDTAQKTSSRNDWTVFAEWGFSEGKIYRLNYERDRMKADALRRRFESFVRASHAKNSGLNGNLRAVLVEDKSSGTGLIQEMASRLPIPVTPVQRNSDKLTRAMDAQPHHRARCICIPLDDPQNYEMVSEVASFTHDDSHRFDDQTDVMIDAIDYVFIQPHTKKTGKAGTW